MNKNTEQYYKWREANPDAAKAIQQRYAQTHRKQRRAYIARRRITAADKVKAQEQCQRERNRDKINAYMTNRRNLLRQQCFDHLGGAHCILCGFESTICAQFDLHHIDPTTKQFAISTAISNAYTWDQLKPEVDKCVVLCRNCHGAITTQHPDALPLKLKLVAVMQEQSAQPPHAPLSR